MGVGSGVERGSWTSIAAFFSLSASVLASTPAAAAGWLEWRAPRECPSANYIEQRVSEWLAGELPKELNVHTHLTWNGEAWVVEVEVASGGQSGKRRVAVADCTDAADFVAVTVVLAVDPSLQGSLELPAGAAEESVADQEPIEDGQAASPPSEPAAEAASLPGAVATPKEKPRVAPRLHLSGAVEGSVGILPEPAFGAHLAGGIDLGRLSLSLGARWLAPVATLPPGSVAPIEFSLLAARLVAGYSFFGPRAQFGPTLAFEGGAITTRQAGSPARDTSVPWVGIGLGGMGSLELTGRFGVFLQAELSLPLTQPAFGLSNGEVFHRAELGGRAELGLRFFWTDR